jgi:hypothetical protein
MYVLRDEYERLIDQMEIDYTTIDRLLSPAFLGDARYLQSYDNSIRSLPLGPMARDVIAVLLAHKRLRLNEIAQCLNMLGKKKIEKVRERVHSLEVAGIINTENDYSRLAANWQEILDHIKPRLSNTERIDRKPERIENQREGFRRTGENPDRRRRKRKNISSEQSVDSEIVIQNPNGSDDSSWEDIPF